MATFLFWNTAKRDLTIELARLVQIHDVDLVILAEADAIPVVQFLETVNVSPEANLRLHEAPGQKRIRLFSRFPSGTVVPVADRGGISIRRVRVPGCDELLLVAAHLPSKLHWPPREQYDLCTRIRDDIDEAETHCGHQRTLVVGDLNMNPFEHGVVSSEGLHAVATRRDAARRKRVVDGVERYLFYNPMWAHLGERSHGPPGTFYQPRSTSLSYFWNIYDQVLIRPALLDAFSDESLRILTESGDRPLINRHGCPDRKHASDHLPILFKIRLTL